MTNKKKSKFNILLKEIGEDAICRFDATRFAKGTQPVAKVREEMQRTMQKYCSVFRSCAVLQRGCREMTRIFTCLLPDLCVSFRIIFSNPLILL